MKVARSVQFHLHRGSEVESQRGRILHDRTGGLDGLAKRTIIELRVDGEVAFRRVIRSSYGKGERHRSELFLEEDAIVKEEVVREVSGGHDLTDGRH